MSRRLGVLEALGRAASNLRGNLELVWIQIGASVALAAVVLVGVLALLAAFGLAPKLLLEGDPEAIRGALETLAGDWTAPLRHLGAALLVFLVTTTVAFLAYCWFQAGTLAVLMAGEAQAPPARGAKGAVFRTFSWGGFGSWATRYYLRLFGLINLFLLFQSAALLGLLLPIYLFGRLAGEEGNAAACLVGCGVAIPILFVLLVLVIAMTVAELCVVEEGDTVRAATRRGFAITGRRLGSFLILYSLLLAGAVALAIFFGGVGVVVELALAGSAWKALPTTLLSILQMAASAALSLLFLAAQAALVKSERRLENRSA